MPTFHLCSSSEVILYQLAVRHSQCLLCFAVRKTLMVQSLLILYSLFFLCLKVMFLPSLSCVCLFACVSLNRITRKVVDEFS